MNNEEIPYRSPAHVAPGSPASSQDENDYSTLKEVKKILDESLEGLHKDFNAFTLLKGEDIEKVKNDLFNQVSARQVAYDLLVPIQSLVDSAIESVKEKRRG